MSGLNADNLLAAAVVWAAIMLPSSAFGHDPAAVPRAGGCHVMEMAAFAGIELGDVLG
jgi:hypothetical protein